MDIKEAILRSAYGGAPVSVKDTFETGVLIANLNDALWKAGFVKVEYGYRNAGRSPTHAIRATRPRVKPVRTKRPRPEPITLLDVFDSLGLAPTLEYNSGIDGLTGLFVHDHGGLRDYLFSYQVFYNPTFRNTDENTRDASPPAPDGVGDAQG